MQSGAHRKIDIDAPHERNARQASVSNDVASRGCRGPTASACVPASIPIVRSLEQTSVQLAETIANQTGSLVLACGGGNERLLPGAREAEAGEWQSHSRFWADPDRGALPPAAGGLRTP